MFQEIIELQQAQGAKAKALVLEKYKDDAAFCRLLYYALNPLISYHLSEETLRGLNVEEFATPTSFTNILNCCEYLSGLKGIDDKTTREVGAMLNMYPKAQREICIGILSKTLRLGVTAKTVNRVIRDLIPEWEVQQAYPIDKYPIQEGTEFWLTQKLNGVRATFYRGELYARSGQIYTGLEHITNSLKHFTNGGIVLDGELTLKEKGNLSDNEAFRIATGILNGENVEDKTRICYTIFDVISVEDFENTPVVTYSVRRSVLDGIRDIIESDCTRVLPVLYHGTDQRMIWKLLEQMVAEDKEGLMLNTDVPYYRTRHKGILKVKQFYSMDLPIIRCEEGSGRLSGKLGAFVLDFQGNEVKVGSGFSDEQRVAYWQNRESVPGLLCEVKYKEISTDKHTGLQSLQFPVFIRVRDDKADVSYG